MPSNYGNKITDFGRMFPAGTYGYIIGIDLLTNRIRAMYGVKMQGSDEKYSLMTTAAAPSLAAIADMVENPNAPDLAFFRGGNICYVFLKTSKYDYIDDTRIGVFYHGNSIPPVTMDSKFDNPDSYKALIRSLFLRNLKNVNGTRIELDLTNEINRQRKALGLNISNVTDTH